MGWENWYLRFFFLLQLVTADLCPEPVIPNGVVRGEKEQDLFFGDVTCNVGFHLVGSKNIKCRHGVWSQKELPVCAAIGGCPTLPEVHNGRNVPIQKSRGSAYRFKCNRGFKRFGESRTHCVGDRWSHTHMPSCTKSTCDVIGMLDIPYGEGRAMMRGAVFKYRCNKGVEMEGSNTLVCDGENWNGTVPHCNVGPSEPELEVIVTGKVVTSVKAGDWVLVTCQAKGGHPLPDIGLTLDGIPTGSKDFRNFENSFTFEASIENDGQVILCSALNKVGSSVISTILHVLSPPLKAAISGPTTILPNNEYVYECSVDGGNPTPKISWTVRDHLGKSKVMKGEMVSSRVSMMSLLTSSDDRMLIINCLAENSEGVVSHTMHVNTHYLPTTVEIRGPDSVHAGEYGHFNCFSTESFPVPELKWKVEKFGKVYEVDNIDADISTDALEDGGVIAFSKIDILFEPGTTHATVHCSAMVEGLGQTHAKSHNVKIISKEMPHQNIKGNKDVQEIEENKDVANIKENKDVTKIKEIKDFTKIKENNDVAAEIENNQDTDKTKENKGVTKIEGHKDVSKIENNKYVDENKENKEVTESNENKDLSEKNFHDHSEEKYDEYDQPEKDFVILNEEKSEFEEEDRSKSRWIPLHPTKDIQEYQDLFASFKADIPYEEEDGEDFQRPFDILEATMLKQEKKVYPTVEAKSALFVSTVYSSSPSSYLKTILLVVALFTSTFLY